MRNIVIISGHLFQSKRKAGFHLLADAFSNLGYNVLFITAPFSYLYKLKSHYSKEINIEKNKLILNENNIHSYVHFTPFHIANFRNKTLNFFTGKLYKLYLYFSLSSVEEEITQADLIIFESTPGLFLFEKIKKMNTRAKCVYRVSDDIELLGVHPSLVNYEKNIISDFDLVSVPSLYIFNKIQNLSKQINLKLHYHGLKKDLFDQKYDNPYKSIRLNAVFIGISRLDYEFLSNAANNHPEIHFHIIGPLETKVLKDNITYYGEMKFENTIPYIKHADIGLHTLEYSTGAESFTDSLKVHQYTYCNLPIIAPSFLKSSRVNTFYYNDQESISVAISNAKLYNNSLNDLRETIFSWEELANKLIKE